MFSLTGFTLNHAHWFSNDVRDGELQKPLPHDIAQQLKKNGLGTASIDMMSDFLFAKHKLKTARAIELDSEAGEILFDYELPAGYATAIVDVHRQAYLLEYRIGGLVSLLNDLHKGRHTGKYWSWLIDFSAFFIVLFAITGMVILFQNKKHRRQGMWVAIAGALSPVLIYFVLVPRLAGV